MSDQDPQTQSSAYSAFWLYKATAHHFGSEPERSKAASEVAGLIECRTKSVALRGAYSTTGFTAGVDLILWLVAEDAAAFQELGIALHQSQCACGLELVQAYVGFATTSQYDPTHGPAFLRGLPPKRYLSLYPFTKTPEWYLLPFEERRSLMAEHGKMGQEFPSIQTNTVSSFGVADQEFIVALEDDDPSLLIKMIQRLRAAEVRKYTQTDTPVFFGLRRELFDALRDAL
jgi:hydrogen peroxide-dependent heme synthase